LAHTERTNIAVFIDFDNIEIGVKSTLGEHFDIGTILEALKERGEVVTKIAYADWTRAGEYSRNLTQHAIRLVQRNLTPGGDKNGADINLALDALEMAFTHPHINAYVIVGGDSDFLSLVEKLKQYDKKVFVVGGRAFTSIILQRNCHEFIAYENLIRKPSMAKGGRPVAPTASQPIAQAFPIVRRALKILADREVTPQTGLLKSTLLQLDSTFSERTYGGSSFLDFAEKLAQAGLVQLKHAGRSVTVELNSSFDEADVTAPDTRSPVETAPAHPEPAAATAITPPPPPQPQPQPAGDTAEGVRIAGELLRAASGARWPMYLRNFKQILRAASFDERRYGFGGLMDLVRACGREGLVRAERDRRGGIRIFRGSALGPAPAPAIDDNIGNRAPAAPPAEPSFDDASDAQPADLDGADGQEESAPIAVVDTTAELLGRAKARKPRARVQAAPRRTTKKAAPAARKSRGRKSASEESREN
jgi:uncharacterized LabA/DUF88 family protein